MVFRNPVRPRLLQLVVESKKPMYISDAARRLKISKRTALLNFSELEDEGLLKSEWKVIEVDERPTLVKAYRINPTVARLPVREILGISSQ